MSVYGQVGPMSRQVVKPAISVTSALWAPCSAACPGVVFSSSSSQCTPVLVRCVWRSISPGSRVAPPRSITRAPEGIGSALPTASMRSPRMMTTAGEIGAPPRPSIRLGGPNRDHRRRRGLGAEDGNGGDDRKKMLHDAAYNTRQRPPGGRGIAGYSRESTIVPPFTTARSRSPESLNYREWSGYYAVSAYEAHHEHEYNAIRNASALIDVSPLFKYLISGRDADEARRSHHHARRVQACGRPGVLHAVVRRARQGDRRRDGDARCGRHLSLDRRRSQPALVHAERGRPRRRDRRRLRAGRGARAAGPTSATAARRRCAMPTSAI